MKGGSQTRSCLTQWGHSSYSIVTVSPNVPTNLHSKSGQGGIGEKVVVNNHALKNMYHHILSRHHKWKGI